MFSVLNVSITSICLTLSLICGWRMWVSRGKVPDRSRTFLSLLDFMLAIWCGMFLISAICGYTIYPPRSILEPTKSIGGLYAITLFMYYPIEVMRPRGLRGRWWVGLWLPSLLVTLPVICGMQFQTFHSWPSLWEHLLDWDVLLRLLCIFFVTVFSILLLVIPYNWRQSSADYRWVRRVTLLAQGISVFFYGNVLTELQFFPSLHTLWAIFAMLYFTYYELFIRVMVPQAKAQRPQQMEPEQSISATSPSAQEGSSDLWLNICKVMDELEAWRNPNTTVETFSTSLGTNRIYVARCIREHTGMTFNDYLNKKRIDYMVSQLRRNPHQSHKELYFEAGFRSRHAAYRNFVKFQGCSPTDFIATLS